MATQQKIDPITGKPIAATFYPQPTYQPQGIPVAPVAAPAAPVNPVSEADANMMAAALAGGAPPAMGDTGAVGGFPKFNTMVQNLFGGTAKAPVAAVAPTGMPTQAQARRVDNAVMPSAPVTPGAQAATPDQGAVVGGMAPGSIAGATDADRLAQDNRDLVAQRELNAAKVAQQALTDPAPGMAVIDNGGADRNAAFNEGAALRTAAARGSWSPRRGFQGDDAAVQAALAPIAARARASEVAARNATETTVAGMRDRGETTRTNIRETGDSARAAATDAQRSAALDLQRQEFGLKAPGVQLDNAAKQRIEAVQQEIATAKTPEARRTAAEKLAALTGKATQDQFAALELGGGQTVDASGIAVQQPKTAIIYNKATGQRELVSAGAPATAAPAGMRMVGTSNGKPVYEDANGKRVTQ